MKQRNYVQKNMNKYNRAQVHVDRKKSMKRGKVKYKPNYKLNKDVQYFNVNFV